ncbi:MAG: transcriptional repressor [Thermoguttaceae bacterium]|jgi:Fur family ferric uptake transcriptional regulator
MISSNLHRNTRQRKLILEELRKLKTHPTAAGLYAIVRRRMPKISLGTVYRNLELLNQRGMIQKLDFSSGEARYDGNVEDHDHLRCVYCMRVDDVPGPPIAIKGVGKENWGGYKVRGHRLEFFGVCPLCRRRRAE